MIEATPIELPSAHLVPSSILHPPRSFVQPVMAGRKKTPRNGIGGLAITFASLASLASLMVCEEIGVPGGDAAAAGHRDALYLHGQGGLLEGAHLQRVRRHGEA